LCGGSGVYCSGVIAYGWAMTSHDEPSPRMQLAQTPCTVPSAHRYTLSGLMREQLCSLDYMDWFHAPRKFT